MTSTPASELLSLWESGIGIDSTQRGLLLLQADGQGGAEDLACLSLGQRDEKLIALRERLFGREMECTAQCPACGSVVEFALDTRALRAAGALAAPADAPRTVAWQDWTIEFRLLDSRDMAAVAGARDAADAKRMLIARCILACADATGAQPASALPEAAVAAVADRMEALDPLGAIAVGLSCPDCGCECLPGFDPEQHVWSEIAAAAQRLLEQVHGLAHAYGWREADILAMSAERRQFYLDRVGA